MRSTSLSPFFRPGAAGRSRNQRSAFSVLELMVSMTILGLLMVMVLEMLTSTQRSWSNITTTANQFREARMGFETISRRLRQATLNTYWDYSWNRTVRPPRPYKYVRQSELHFTCGPTPDLVLGIDRDRFPTHSVFFQAPFGFTEQTDLKDLPELLNAWGYFIEYGDDSATVPPFLRDRVPKRYRYRLKEFRQPTEELSLFDFTDPSEVDVWYEENTGRDKAWYSKEVKDEGSTQKRVVAENIVALVLTPLRPSRPGESGEKHWPLSNNYIYDSRERISEGRVDPQEPQAENLHMLPHMMRVTMVALDETTFNRLEAGANPPKLVPQGLFRNATRYDDDIKELQELFDEKGYNYSIFTTVFPMRAARWVGERS